MKHLSILFVAATLAQVSCGSGEATRPSPSTANDGASPTTDASATGSAPASTSTGAPTSPSSLAAIDPEVRAALEKFLACKPNDFDCENKVDLGEFSALWKKDGALGTLLALLDHPDPRARFIAALQLRTSRFGSKQPGFAADAAQAAHVIAALEKEKEAQTAEVLALDVGCISWSATGLGERIEKLYAGATPAVRRSILARLMDNNVSEPKALALVRSALKDPDAKTRKEALDAFEDKGLKNEACDVWLAATSDKDREFAHHAFFKLADGGWRCPDKADKVTDAFEASPTPEGDLLKMWCAAPKATASTQKRGATLGEKWAKTAEASPSARIDALKAVVACDAKKGKALAATMAKDSDEYVQREAAALAK